MNLYSVTFVVLPNEHWRMAVRADSPYEALEQALPHYKELRRTGHLYDIEIRWLHDEALLQAPVTEVDG